MTRHALGPAARQIAGATSKPSFLYELPVLPPPAAPDLTAGWAER